MSAQNPYELSTSDQAEIQTWARSKGLNAETQLTGARDMLISGKAANMDDLRRFATGGALPYSLTAENETEIRNWATGLGLNADTQVGSARGLLASGAATDFNDLKSIVQARDATAQANQPGTTTKDGVTTYSVSKPSLDTVKTAATSKAGVASYTPDVNAATDAVKAGTTAATIGGYTADLGDPSKIKTASTQKADAVGYDAQTYTAGGYTPEGYTAGGYTADKRGYNTYNAKQGTAQKWDVTPEQTVESRLEGLLTKGSPLLTLAETRSRQAMAGKGLLNSSMAEGEALRAMTETATPIAAADAATFARAGQFNTEQKNVMEQFNVREVNAAEAFNADSANQALSDNQRAENASREFLANAQNASKAFTAESRNQAAKFLADAINVASAATAQAKNNAAAFKAQAQNASSIQAAADANAASRDATEAANRLQELATAATNEAARFTAEQKNLGSREDVQAKNAAELEYARQANQFKSEATTAKNRAKELETQAKNASSVQEAADLNAASRDAIAAASRLQELATAAENDRRRFEAEAKNRSAENDKLIKADKDLADLNNTARNLSDTSGQAMTLYNSASERISNLMANADLDTNAKQSAINQEKANLKTGLDFLESVTKIEGLSDLLKFSDTTASDTNKSSGSDTVVSTGSDTVGNDAAAMWQEEAIRNGGQYD